MRLLALATSAQQYEVWRVWKDLDEMMSKYNCNMSLNLAGHCVQWEGFAVSVLVCIEGC